MNTIPLRGCAPVPLAQYLKSLGILRLLAEQHPDVVVKGCWQDESFVLYTTLDQEALLDFFLREYRPTPILVPWSGSDFFDVDEAALSKPEEPFDKRPTSHEAIESVLSTDTERLAGYRVALKATLEAIRNCGIRSKKDIEGSGTAQKRKKASLLLALRNSLPDAAVIWIDAAAVIEEDAFSPNNLLGSGGGSDGNSHFSDNFMQALWAVLADFDGQRKKPLTAANGAPFDSRAALCESMFAVAANNTQLAKLSPVLFDSTRVGGPNSTSGFESESASNPWDYVFMLEGACLFAGALAKKHGAATPGTARFPFLLGASPVGTGSMGPTEGSGKELWLPLWPQPSCLGEIRELFANGRIEAQKRIAACGLDAVQAVAQSGIDRGIPVFHRVGLFRGRIGGDNYFTSAQLGRFVVSRNAAVDLFADFDSWLAAFRNKASGPQAPASIDRALRQLESSILAACEHPGRQFIQGVLTSLGRCEQAMAHSLHWVIDAFVRPIPALCPAWLDAANDDSPEYSLAASLASILGKYADTYLSIRHQFEPIKSGVKNGSLWIGWDETASVDVAWHEGDAVDALNAVMARRVLLAQKAGADAWHDTARRFASFTDIAAFLEGHFDLQRFSDLLGGLMLLDWPRIRVEDPKIDKDDYPGTAWSLMKLCFAGFPVCDVEIPLVPAIHQRARAQQTEAATELASRRLRASGLAPAVEHVHLKGPAASRAAAALLFPISQAQVAALAKRVLRPKIER